MQFISFVKRKTNSITAVHYRIESQKVVIRFAKSQCTGFPGVEKKLPTIEASQIFSLSDISFSED